LSNLAFFIPAGQANIQWMQQMGDWEKDFDDVKKGND
jgi:hypothetical protein